MTREGTIRIGDRTVAFLEAGDPGGPLVLHRLGGPSSQLEVALFDRQVVRGDRPVRGGPWALADPVALEHLAADQHAGLLERYQLRWKGTEAADALTWGASTNRCGAADSSGGSARTLVAATTIR